MYAIRAVGAGGAGGGHGPPDFNISVNPISTREVNIPITLLLAPLVFSDLPMALAFDNKL